MVSLFRQVVLTLLGVYFSNKEPSRPSISTDQQQKTPASSVKGEE